MDVGVGDVFEWFNKLRLRVCGSPSKWTTAAEPDALLLGGWPTPEPAD